MMKATNPIPILLFLGIFISVSYGQSVQNVSFVKKDFSIDKVKVFDPKSVTPSFGVTIESVEPPTPGGNSYRSGLLELKREARKRTPIKHEKSSFNDQQNLEKPEYLNGFPMMKYFKALDTIVMVSGGTPLDNTLAISNDDFLMCGVNSRIYMHDLKLGIVPNENNVTVVEFSDFAVGYSTDFPFDPKILYDPELDRFIVTFLTGRSPSTSGIILAFSTTNNPTDPWNVYKISGNPLNNNTWTDYPAMALTKNELFLTVNLLIPNVDWKVGFSSTLIWQFNKHSGFSGDTALSTTLWSNIALDGRNLRNLAPVQGGDSLHGPNIFLLSNRNFDLENDSIFMVEVTNERTHPDVKINIFPVVSDQKYGLPPNGRQANSDPNDPADGFDTNDARVLGSIKVGNSIQFVGNTMNFSTGLAGVYHGFIENLDTSPTLTAQIIGDADLDFGYPNIAFTGGYDCKNSSFIAFNHTSPTRFSGTSMVRYKDGEYSELLTLKEGENYVDRMPGTYERWGDYYGIQRQYNKPGKVWGAGFYGIESKGSATWISQLSEEGTCACMKPIGLTIKEISTSDINLCLGKLVVEVENGIEPYSFSWNNGASSNQYLDVDLCSYNEQILVKDSMDCYQTASAISTKELPSNIGTIYPNPVVDGTVNVYFQMATSTQIEVQIFSAEGKLIQNILNTPVNAGNNLLSFNTLLLNSGMYILIIKSGDDRIYKGKFEVQ